MIRPDPVRGACGANLRAEDSWPVGFLALDPPRRRQPGMAVLSAVMGKEQISVRGSVTLIEIVEQRFRLFEIGRVEAFGEPAVDRCEKGPGFGVSTLVAAEPGEARGGAQFPELRS